jgi:hypothetical protein
MVSRPLLIGIGIAAVAGYGIYKGFSLSETAGNINVTLASLPKIHKIDLSGLQISVDLRVDNPGKERITVKIPSVRLSYKGKLVANTAISNKTYTIEPVTSGKISGIMVETSYLNLITAAPTIITDFKAQGTNITDYIGFDVMAEVNGLPIKVQKL